MVLLDEIIRLEKCNLQIQQIATSFLQQIDVTLPEIETIHLLNKNQEIYYYFLATYYYQKGDIQRALENIEIAFEKRTTDKSYAYLAFHILLKAGDLETALYYHIMNEITPAEAATLIEHLISLGYHKDLIQKLYQKCSGEVNTSIRDFPKKHKISLDTKTGLYNLTSKIDSYYFLKYKYINQSLEEYNFFTTIYNQQKRNIAFDLINNLVTNSDNSFVEHLHLKSELVKVKQVYICDLKYTGSDYIIPICTVSDSNLVFKFKNNTSNFNIGKGEYKFLRINQDVQIQHENKDAFLLGKAIPLIHSKSRKKLVLNIFLDSLTMKYILERNFTCIPNIKKFFEDGLIFCENFTTAEYTAPALASVRTGVYTNEAQAVNILHLLSKKIITTAEHFKKAGYFTSGFSCLVEEVCSNRIRGFDKYIVQDNNSYHISQQVADIIEHLEAFDETDNYIELSSDGAHRAVESGNVRFNLDTQTKVDIEDFTKPTFGRNYSISESLFPGQTYKVNIHTLTHSFRLETDSVTKKDGTINLNKFSCHLIERKSDVEIINIELTKEFLMIIWEHTKDFRRN